MLKKTCKTVKIFDTSVYRSSTSRMAKSMAGTPYATRQKP